MKRRGVRVVPQRRDWDCGVASLAMLLNKPYADVSMVAREQVPAEIRRKYGLHLHHIEAIASRFGAPLARVYRSNGYLLNAKGILGVKGGAMHWAGHWVVLQNNNIIDPDGAESWPVLDYLAAHDARPCTLLVEA